MSWAVTEEAESAPGRGNGVCGGEIPGKARLPDQPRLNTQVPSRAHSFIQSIIIYQLKMSNLDGSLSHSFLYSVFPDAHSLSALPLGRGTQN